LVVVTVLFAFYHSRVTRIPSTIGCTIDRFLPTDQVALYPEVNGITRRVVSEAGVGQIVCLGCFRSCFQFIKKGLIDSNQILRSSNTPTWFSGRSNGQKNSEDHLL